MLQLLTVLSDVLRNFVLTMTRSDAMPLPGARNSQSSVPSR